MSVSIKICHAKKVFNKTDIVIKDLSLDIKEGEFFTLLGPSGCGKTTLLRMIAGFNTIEGGDIFFDDKRINNIEPDKRNIGMVFQNYAIFPHMNVRQNVEFGLKNRKLPKDEIKDKTDKFLKLMQIDKYEDRMPDRLSGGQQQRVALARALCISPDVLLMDEPLSNLDAKLRVEMRSVIKNIQNSIGITCVYVTHDQEEAMAVSDRIAVMNGGVIQHIGTPRNIYQRPSNLFVATFIGRTNVLKGKLIIENNNKFLLINENKISLDNVKDSINSNQNVIVSVRPEEFVLNKESEIKGISGEVTDAIFLGLNTHYFVKLDTGDNVEIIKESTLEDSYKKGTRINLRLNKEKINIFTEDGNENILNGVNNDLSLYK